MFIKHSFVKSVNNEYVKKSMLGYNIDMRFPLIKVLNVMMKENQCLRSFIHPVKHMCKLKPK